MAHLPSRHEFMVHRLTPYTQPNDEEGEKECSICTETCSSPVQIPSCGHVFCREHLLEWCRDKYTCPNCRAELFTDAIPLSERLLEISPTFWNLLNFHVYDREEVQKEVQHFDGLMRVGILYATATLPGDQHIIGNYFDIQAILLGAAIWLYNKVDDDWSSPQLRAVFEADWIKLIHALDRVLLQHANWEGESEYLRKRLKASVYPSKEEPLRKPEDPESWGDNLDAEQWMEDDDGWWRESGWAAHVQRIDMLIEYVLNELCALGMGNNEELLIQALSPLIG